MTLTSPAKEARSLGRVERQCEIIIADEEFHAAAGNRVVMHAIYGTKLWGFAGSEKYCVQLHLTVLLNHWQQTI